MDSTRSRSSRHTAPGRHSSRRLQLAQVTSNFGVGFIGRKLCLRLWMAMTVAMTLPSLKLGGACGDQVGHAVEFLALVEEASRPEPLGELAIGVGGEVGQNVEIDLE